MLIEVFAVVPRYSIVGREQVLQHFDRARAADEWSLQ